MVNPADSQTISDDASHGFSTEFTTWLVSKSKEMAHASLSEVASSIRSDSTFSRKFYVFESLDAAAKWYSQPENVVFDAFVSYFIGDGFPIYGVSLATDQV